MRRTKRWSKKKSFRKFAKKIRTSILKPPPGISIKDWKLLPPEMQREHIQATEHIKTWIDDYYK